MTSKVSAQEIMEIVVMKSGQEAQATSRRRSYAPKYPHVAGIYPTTSKTWQKNHDRFNRHVVRNARSFT